MANTLLLVDDHVLFREGVAALASRHWDDFEVVGEASNGQEALEMARELLPDIILMDVSMPVMDGLEATRRLHRELPTSRVVILTVSEDEANLFEAIKSGAVGYVLKNRSEEHTSELQSRENLVCRLLLEKKKRTSHR